MRRLEFYGWCQIEPLPNAAVGETYPEKRFGGNRTVEEEGREQEAAPPKHKETRKERKEPIDPNVGMELSEDFLRCWYEENAWSPHLPWHSSPFRLPHVRIGHLEA